MSDEAAPSAQITFNIKSSSDQKYVVTVPDTMTVLELKEKLSTSEYADVAAERQRLIYSGRVLKDPDVLSTYKIKDGNTVHMVKGAASNARQNPANSSSTVPGAGQAPTGVPQMATGTAANDPMAQLTGARYAGFAQMPGADMFGPDGGVSQAVQVFIGQPSLTCFLDGTATRPREHAKNARKPHGSQSNARSNE